MFHLKHARGIVITIRQGNRPMSQPTIQEIGAQKLTSCGYVLDTSAACLGSLRSSIDIVGDAQALRTRMREDGYLFLPGYLDRELMIETRGPILRRSAAAGLQNEGESARKPRLRRHERQIWSATHQLVWLD